MNMTRMRFFLPVALCFSVSRPVCCMEDGVCFSDVITRSSDSQAASLFVSLREQLGPEFVSKRGVPLLYLACAHNQPKLTAALLAAGADPNVQVRTETGIGTVSYRTPLARAVAEGLEGVVDVLLASPRTELVGAACTLVRDDCDEVTRTVQTIDELVEANIKSLEVARDKAVSGGRSFGDYSQEGLRSMLAIKQKVTEVRAARQPCKEKAD